MHARRLLIPTFATLLFTVFLLPAKTVLLTEDDHNTRLCLLTEDDHNTRLCLLTGDTLTIQLKSNPTTGYSWAVSEASPSLQLAKEKSIPPDTQLPGAGGAQRFEFKVINSGDSRLTLAYRRLWEKEKPPAQFFSIQITIESRPKGSS